ncbi:MAG: hypothetical protein O7F76_07400 [Planctomycetota bacterium]|nr:hypothetical protein [Planctomycetota bacterium]
MSTLCRVVLSIAIGTLVCTWAASVPAQEGDSSASVRRVRGIIQKDETWSGTVIVTDDLTIDGAKVTILPGTIVEFADRRKRHGPTLTVGGWNKGFRGYLEILSEPDRPVVFRTRAGSQPGRLVVNVRGETTSASFHSKNPREKPPPPKKTPGRVVWEHVRFEGLGEVESKQVMKKQILVARPAITFKVAGGAHTLSLTHCTFDRSTRVKISAADGSRISLLDNLFTNETERVALEIAGVRGQPPPDLALVSRNRFSCAISLESISVQLTDNILIGPYVAVAVNALPKSDVRITGNYVHNTSMNDDGRYALNCEYAGAVIENNIFRGGSTCVLNGSRLMTGNVMIGAPRLEVEITLPTIKTPTNGASSKNNPRTPRTVLRSSKTHRLVAALPSGSLFERNLLLGPAHSLLAPQPRLVPRDGEDRTPHHKQATILRNNLLDGFGASNRGIHLGSAGRRAQPIGIHGNVFLRINSVVLVEDDGNGATIEFGVNAAAPPPARVIHRVGSKDAADGPGLTIVEKDVASFYLVGIPPERVPDFDADIQSGKLTTGTLRNRLFESYRPREGSPLIVKHNGAKSTLGPGTGNRE